MKASSPSSSASIQGQQKNEAEIIHVSWRWTGPGNSLAGFTRHCLRQASASVVLSSACVTALGRHFTAFGRRGTVFSAVLYTVFGRSPLMQDGPAKYFLLVVGGQF